MKTKFLIVRHGQSESNKYAIFAGQSEYPLSETGLKQAEMVKDALKNEKIDAIYSSSLSRAYSTACPLAQEKGLSITKDDALCEMYFGEWENKSKKDLIDNYPNFALWTQNPAIVKANGAETIQEVADRFYSALQSIAKTNPGKTVAIFSHGEIIMLFLCKIGYFNADFTTKSNIPYNASITTVSYENGAFEVGEFSNKQHLGTLTTELNLA